MIRNWKRVIWIATLMGFLSLGSCEDPIQKEANRIARRIKASVHAAKDPFIVLVKDSNSPQRAYYFLDGRKGKIVFSDERSEDIKAFGVHRSASIAIGEAFSVMVRYSEKADGSVAIHDVSVADNDRASMDWLGDGSYDFRAEFQSKKQFLRCKDQWLEAGAGDQDSVTYFRRKLKKTGEWVRFNRATGHWEYETERGE